jgi:hypothetical protein
METPPQNFGPLLGYEEGTAGLTFIYPGAMQSALMAFIANAGGRALFRLIEQQRLGQAALLAKLDQISDQLSAIGGGTPDEPAETPISTNEELADALWTGQNDKITAENRYCNQLQARFKAKEEKVSGLKDKLLDVVEEVAGDWLAKVIGGTVGSAVTGWTANPALGGAASWLAGFATQLGLEWGLDALVDLLTRGNEMIAGIKAENAHLLQLEKSRENYEYREIALARHREDIKMILEQLRTAEKQVDMAPMMDMNALLESLIALQYNTEEIKLPSGSYINLRGRYHGGM